MADQQTWEQLPKTVIDPQTIEEAIDEAISIHNGDAESHMSTGEAIENHRDNDVLDHPAESVVNDKMAIRARAYVAIVDPESDEDFDTIESAVAYAIGVGGGAIFIVGGTHYIGSIVELPISVSIIGEDIDTTIIVTDYSSDEYFSLVEDTSGGQINWSISNCTVVGSGGPCFTDDNVSSLNEYTVSFTGCHFTGGGNYILLVDENIWISQCTFECTAVYAIQIDGRSTIRDCIFSRSGSTSSGLAAITYSDTITPVLDVTIDNCRFLSGGATACLWVQFDAIPTTNLLNCRLEACGDLSISGQNSSYICNYFTFTSSNMLYMDTGSRMIFLGNILDGGSGSKFSVGESEDSVFVGNSILNGGNINIGNGSVAGNNTVGFLTVATSTTNLIFDSRFAIQLTPTSTRTLTADVPPSGTEVCLIILTSGTSSYTLTFGTGFKTTGTLATGVTSARRFVMKFISDGTQLIEQSRTTAIA